MRTLSILFLYILIFSGCTKDLPRNNPKDINSNNYVPPPPQLVFSRYIVEQGNDSAGGTVYLTIYLKNVGQGSAQKVQVNISSSSSYISPTTFGTHSFDDMAAGAEGEGYYVYNTDPYTIIFTLSNSTPIGTLITFNMAVTASSTFQNNSINYSVTTDYNWSDSFTMLVK
jgi:hypothetical protein